MRRPTSAAVLEHVGAGPAEIPAPPLRRQGDDRSARWVERFRGEREAVAAVSVSELQRLEAESIHVMREVAAELERPVLMFSGGKDSLVLLRLAEKAFRPGALPFPILHVDTGHNFPEVIEFRDRLIEALDEQLIVASVQEAIDAGRVKRGGPVAQPPADRGAARGDRGAPLRRRLRRRAPRRGARAGEGARPLLPRRVRPVGPARPAPRGLEPLQRPAAPGRARPRVPAARTGPSSTSGTTSQAEGLELPSIYLAHERRVFERDGMLLAESEWLEPARRRGGLRDRRCATARSAT